RGNRAKKVESRHFNAFKSENYPLLAKAGISIDFYENAILPHPEKPLHVHQQLDDNVAILKLFPGITPQVMRSVLETPGLRGIVLETFGAGNAPTAGWLLEMLQDALSRGIYIL